MLTQKTVTLVNELIQGLTKSAIKKNTNFGTVQPADLEALASLIVAVRGDPPQEGSPCIGFTLPSPEEDEDS